MTDSISDGIDAEQPLFPGGIGEMLRALAAPEQQSGTPTVHTFQPAAAEEPVPLLPWMDPGLDLSAVTRQEAQRHASIGFCRMMLHADRQAVLGTDSEPPTWAEAEAFYERVQADAEGGQR